MSEKTRKELEKDLMKMPELEKDSEIVSPSEKELLGNLYDKAFENGRKAERLEYQKEKEEEKEISKRMHELNTFQCVENELYLRGKDEYGKDFTLCFDAFNFLEWIDKEQIQYIKKQLIRYIKSK